MRIINPKRRTIPQILRNKKVINPVRVVTIVRVVISPVKAVISNARAVTNVKAVISSAKVVTNVKAAISPVISNAISSPRHQMSKCPMPRATL